MVDLILCLHEKEIQDQIEFFWRMLSLPKTFPKKIVPNDFSTFRVQNKLALQ